MSNQNKWKENRLDRSYDCRNDGAQSVYVADEPTNEECKQFSDYYAEIGGQGEALITQKLGEIGWKCNANEEQIQKIRRKLQSTKKNRHKMHREIKRQRKIIKAMVGENNALQKKQKQLEGKVELMEKIIIEIACMTGHATPHDTLKDVHREYKSLYKSCFRKGYKKVTDGAGYCIEASYKEVD